MLPRVVLLLLPSLSALHGCAGTRAGAPPPAPSPIRFEERAAAAGLRFRWGNEGKSPLTNLETFGCGCAFLDYDDDGLLDVLLVGEPLCGLFRNRGDGTFADMTAASGLAAVRGPWKGCAAADADGDGTLDLLLTGFNDLRLLRGSPDGRFRDVTRESGLRPQGWSSSAGFMDLDGDGDLDLVVGSYVEFGPNARRYCELVRGVRSGCPPHEYEPQFARYYENSGAGRFIDRSRRAGMETTHGKALAVGFVDFNGDGRMDFYLANDGTPGDLMENQGGGRFRNVGLESGAAFGAMGQAQAGMGVDWSDFDGDGAMDFAVTAFSGEPYSLYRGVGMLFEHAGDRMGLAAPTRTRLGFGVKFTDVDCDGWPDLVFVNGHVYDNAHLVSPELSYRQPTMLLRNEEGRRFRLLGSEAGEGLARPIVGRGLAAGDYDNDGREDLLIVDYEGTPLLLRNVGPRVHHWLIVDVRSRGRPAYGARVEVRAGPRRWKRWVSPASAYLSSSDPRLHFGVGAATQVDVSVRWPGGFRRELRDAAVDRILRVDDAR